MPSILTPVLALVCLSLLVWIWMYATRIPAMSKAGVQPQDAMHPGSLNTLPSSVRRVADNYNHLMEQPTIFYALVFYIVLAGIVDPLFVWLAWAYAGLRVIHTLVQCTVNVVNLRFGLFALSTMVLMVMAARAVLMLGVERSPEPAPAAGRAEPPKNLAKYPFAGLDRPIPHRYIAAPSLGRPSARAPRRCREASDRGLRSAIRPLEARSSALDASPGRGWPFGFGACRQGVAGGQGRWNADDQSVDPQAAQRQAEAQQGAGA